MAKKQDRGSRLPVFEQLGERLMVVPVIPAVLAKIKAPAAIMLQQILYWSGAWDGTSRCGPDGWFYKRAEQWEEEISLSRGQVARASAELKKRGLIETKPGTAQGKKCTWYRLNRSATDKFIVDCHVQLRIEVAMPIARNCAIDCTELCNGLHESVHSNTETMTESTIKETPPIPLKGGYVISDAKLEEEFAEAYHRYPGPKRKCHSELAGLKRNHPNWREVIPILVPAIEAEEERKRVTRRPDWEEPWAQMQSWLKGEYWAYYVEDQAAAVDKAGPSPDRTGSRATNMHGDFSLSNH